MSLTYRGNLVLFHNRKILQKEDYPLLDKYTFPSHCSAFYVAWLEKYIAFSSQYFLYFFKKKDIYFFVISTSIIAEFKTVCQFSTPTPQHLLKGIHFKYSDKENSFPRNTIAVLILLIKILSHFSSCCPLLASVSSTSSTQQALLGSHLTLTFPLQHSAQA